MHGELVPITMFIALAVILGLFYYFRYRGRAEMQHTVRAAIERGQELSPEIVERLGEPRRTPFKDLRAGVIAIGIALGIAGIGVALGEPDALRPILSGAMLPLFIGLAYLLLYWLNTKRD